MAKNYKGNFEYTTASDNYQCVVRNFSIPWWVWVIGGAVLLMLASLFIRWNRDMTVQVVDDLNHPVEKADVAVSYTARFCPWLKKDIACQGITNSKGEVTIDDMPVSVWSFLFYHNEPVYVKGAKGNATAADTVPLHSKDRVVLRLNTPRQQIEVKVRTVDAFNGQPVSGAELLVTVDGDGRPGVITTASDGTATIGNIIDRSILDVAARHPDYTPNDTTIYHVQALELRGNVTDIPLNPKVRCNQKVYHTTAQPRVVIDNIDLGKDNGVFKFVYYTDTYPDRMIVRDANGSVLLDTGDVATGYSSVGSDLRFSTRTISVEVITLNSPSGSNWDFTVNCP